MLLSIVRDALRALFGCSVLLLLTACGDGNDLPELQTLFPEVVLTDEGSLTVRGVAVGGDDPLESIVVEVNGTSVSGTLEADGRWTVSDIPLEPGVNDLRVTVVGRSGDEETSFLLTVRREAILPLPNGVALDEQLGEAYVVDAFAQDIFRVDLAHGGVDVLSMDPDTPELRLFAPSVERGSLGGLFVQSSRRVLKVDAATGTREILAELPSRLPFPLEPFPSRGAVPVRGAVSGVSTESTARLGVPPPPPGNISNLNGGLVFNAAGGIAALAPDEAGNRIFVLDQRGVLYVAPATVATPPAEFVDFGVAAAGIFPLDAVYHPESDRVLAINLLDGSIYRYDVSTGLPTVLAEGADEGPPAVEIDLDPEDGGILIADASGALHRLNATTGARTALAASYTSDRSTGVTGLSAGVEQVLITDAVATSVEAYDRLADEWGTLFESRLGLGERLPIQAAALDEANARMLVAVPGAIAEISLITGLRRPILDLPSPSEDVQDSAYLLVPSGDGERVYVALASDRSLAEIDLSTGAIRVLASATIGSGPEFDFISSLALDEANGTLYLGDGARLPGELSRILALDLATLERRGIDVTLAEDEQLGELLFDPARDQLLLNVQTLESIPGLPFLSFGPTELQTLDPATGARAVLAELTPSQLLNPFGRFVLEGSDSVLFVSGANGDPLMARVALASGAVTIIDEGIGRGPSVYGLLGLGAGRAAGVPIAYILDGTGTVFLFDAERGERVIVSK